MQFTITRTATSDEGTVGTGTLDTGENFATLELPWRDNKPLVSCIRSGQYRALMTWSNRFQRNLYHLLDVPMRSAIRIHPGNFAGDSSKGWRTDVDGCILLGYEIGTLNLEDGVSQLALLRSRIAINDFHKLTGGEPIDVKVEWAPGIEPGA